MLWVSASGHTKTLEVPMLPVWSTTWMDLGPGVCASNGELHRVETEKWRFREKLERIKQPVALKDPCLPTSLG